MDDTFVIQQEEHKQHFLEHINSIDLAIKFTVEENKENSAIPFLDTIVKPEAVSILSITVYRKPTHIDQYLQWDSHHHLSAKYSAINTHTHRTKTVCNKLELLQKAMDHLKKAPLTLSPPPLKPKPRATLSYFMPRAYAKASKRSVVSVAYRHSSRTVEPLKHPGFP